MTQEVIQAVWRRFACGATELIAVPRKSHRPGDPARRMLTEKQVLAIIPFSRSTLWRMRKDGRFPDSHNISTKRMFWFEDEIRAWQDAVDGQLPAKRRRRTKKPKPVKQTV